METATLDHVDPRPSPAPRSPMTMLTRSELPLPPELTLPADLHLYANQLGYSPKLPEQEPLARVLRSTGVRPFDLGTVAAYKKKMLQNASPWRAELRAMAQWIIAGGLTAVASIGYIVVCILGGWPSNPITFFSSMAGGFGLAFIINSHSWMDNWANTAPVISWRTRLLNEVKEPIPQFALNTALRIKEAAALHNVAVTFEVEDLFEDFSARARHAEAMRAAKEAQKLARQLDPFLVVVAGTVRYHVEVWGEPSFDESRRV